SASSATARHRANVIASASFLVAEPFRLQLVEEARLAQLQEGGVERFAVLAALLQTNSVVLSLEQPTDDLLLRPPPNLLMIEQNGRVVDDGLDLFSIQGAERIVDVREAADLGAMRRQILLRRRALHGSDGLARQIAGTIDVARQLADRHDGRD